MKLPIVYPLTIPSSQRTMRMIAMVSSIGVLLSSRTLRCNAGAMLVVLATPWTLYGQTAQTSQPQPERPVVDAAMFLAGAGTAFVVHESGHLVADLAFG